MIIRCVIEGCSETVETEEIVSSGVRLICRNHSRSVQVLATRAYDPEDDNRDADIHFQEGQFDKDLRRSGKPIGTEHIRNQGSDVLAAQDISTPRTDGDVEGENE